MVLGSGTGGWHRGPCLPSLAVMARPLTYCPPSPQPGTGTSWVGTESLLRWGVSDQREPGVQGRASLMGITCPGRIPVWQRGGTPPPNLPLVFATK